MSYFFRMLTSILALTLFFFTSLQFFQHYSETQMKAGGSLPTNPDLFSAHIHQGKQIYKKETDHTFQTKVSLAAMGDILIHSTVYKDAYSKKGYNFNPMFTNVKDYINSADIAFCNQETILGGSGLGLSTYPRFNSPYEVGDTLKNIGIDVVSMANNHTLDRGEVAIKNAINHFNLLGIEQTGSFLSNKDRQRIRTITKNDITFAFLAYTYGTNGLPIPDQKEYLVNLIDVPTIENDIRLAKQAAEVIVVSLHFGNEYHRMPNKAQKELTKIVANNGADIILGHHPHVLQPVEWITRNDGKKSFVAYSLGNFLSGQKKKYREIGGILRLTVTKKVKDGEKEIVIQDPSFLPTYVAKNGYLDFQVVPLQDAALYGMSNADKTLKDIQNHMKQWVPELSFEF